MTTTTSTFYSHYMGQRVSRTICLTRMWADTQRDGRPAEYRWRLLFNVAKFG